MAPRIKVIRGFQDLLDDDDGENGCGNPNCVVHGVGSKHPIAHETQIASLRAAAAALQNPQKFKRGDLIRGRTGGNNYTKNADCPHMFWEYLTKPLEIPVEPMTPSIPQQVWDMVMLTCLPDGTVLRYYADSRDWEPYPISEKSTGMH